MWADYITSPNYSIRTYFKMKFFIYPNQIKEILSKLKESGFRRSDACIIEQYYYD